MEGVIISSRRCYCWVYLHQFSYFFFQGAFTHLEPFLAVLFLFLPWNILAEKGQWCVFLSVITLSNDWIDWRLTNLIIIISSTSPPLHIVTILPSTQINSMASILVSTQHCCPAGSALYVMSMAYLVGFLCIAVASSPELIIIGRWEIEQFEIALIFTVPLAGSVEEWD